MDETAKRLDLLRPIDAAGETWDHLDLCEPTAGQIEKAAAHSNEVTATLVLISEVARVPLPIVRRLCKRDLQAASDYLGGFTLGVQSMGGQS